MEEVHPDAKQCPHCNAKLGNKSLVDRFGGVRTITLLIIGGIIYTTSYSTIQNVAGTNAAIILGIVWLALILLFEKL
jgi:hypothetical protein